MSEAARAHEVLDKAGILCNRKGNYLLVERVRAAVDRITELEASNKDLNTRRLEQLGRADGLATRVKELEAAMKDNMPHN